MEAEDLMKIMLDDLKKIVSANTILGKMVDRVRKQSFRLLDSAFDSGLGKREILIKVDLELGAGPVQALHPLRLSSLIRT